MKGGFFDSIRLKRKAEKNVESGRTLLERWWSEKYKLPANHELFRERTEASLTIEWFEDLYVRRAEINAELKEAPPERKIQLMEQLTAVDRVLSDAPKTDLNAPFVTGDPLVDKWEQELAEGGMPDLSEGLNG